MLHRHCLQRITQRYSVAIDEVPQAMCTENAVLLSTVLEFGTAIDLDTWRKGFLESISRRH